MSVRTFVDTNILIYAHDLDAGSKHTKATTVIKSLWETGTGMSSVQVLQEFHVNITRKISTNQYFSHMAAVLTIHVAAHNRSTL